jgi:hypothetical protein
MEIWKLYMEETRNLLVELQALRTKRAEKARRIAVAEELFEISKAQLREIKMRVSLSTSQEAVYSASLESLSGKSLFCAQK